MPKRLHHRNSDSCLIRSDNKSLYSRINQSGRLPEDWNMSLVQSPSTAAPYLALFKLQILPSVYCCANTFMVTVSPDGTWSLSLGNSKEKCELIRGFPTKIQSVDPVVEVVSCLAGSKYCVGNPDGKFVDILNRRGGIFKDQFSKLYNIACSFYIIGIKTVGYQDNFLPPP